jgi:penicillin amidase
MQDSFSPFPRRERKVHPMRQSRRRRWPRRLAWAACGLAALLAVAACAVTLWMYAAERSALPELDGSAQVVGLTAPVTVRRDAHGVPHIEAANESDLFEAQGYVTAQDRLWQMDAFRRNADGTLAGTGGARQDTAGIAV